MPHDLENPPPPVAAAKVRPLFILSLPRSGSTLLLRVLSAHSAISAGSEGWIFLPLVYALQTEGVLAEYGHRTTSRAVQELVDKLPGGRQTYLHEAGHFVSNLYARAAEPGSRYFIDKTPRYWRIASELLQAFPDARFILLTRNLAQVAASMMNTWSGGGFSRLYRYRDDLVLGPPALARAYAEADARILHVRYEDFVSNPGGTLERICAYLGVANEPAALDVLREHKAAGQLGDPTGVRTYGQVSAEPLGKWAAAFKGRIRRRWLGKYLRTFDRETLALFSVDAGLLEQLAAASDGNVLDDLRDLAGLLAMHAVYWSKAHVFLSRNYRWFWRRYLG